MCTLQVALLGGDRRQDSWMMHLLGSERVSSHCKMVELAQLKAVILFCEVLRHACMSMPGARPL